MAEEAFNDEDLLKDLWRKTYDLSSIFTTEKGPEGADVQKATLPVRPEAGASLDVSIETAPGWGRFAHISLKRQLPSGSVTNTALLAPVAVAIYNPACVHRFLSTLQTLPARLNQPDCWQNKTQPRFGGMSGAAIEHMKPMDNWWLSRQRNTRTEAQEPDEDADAETIFRDIHRQTHNIDSVFGPPNEWKQRWADIPMFCGKRLLRLRLSADLEEECTRITAYVCLAEHPKEMTALGISQPIHLEDPESVRRLLAGVEAIKRRLGPCNYILTATAHFNAVVTSALRSLETWEEDQHESIWDQLEREREAEDWNLDGLDESAEDIEDEELLRDVYRHVTSLDAFFSGPRFRANQSLFSGPPDGDSRSVTLPISDAYDLFVQLYQRMGSFYPVGVVYVTVRGVHDGEAYFVRHLDMEGFEDENPECTTRLISGVQAIQKAIQAMDLRNWMSVSSTHVQEVRQELMEIVDDALRPLIHHCNTLARIRLHAKYGTRGAIFNPEALAQVAVNRLLETDDEDEAILRDVYKKSTGLDSLFGPWKKDSEGGDVRIAVTHPDPEWDIAYTLTLSFDLRREDYGKAWIKVRISDPEHVAASKAPRDFGTYIVWMGAYSPDDPECNRRILSGIHALPGILLSHWRDDGGAWSVETAFQPLVDWCSKLEAERILAANGPAEDEPQEEA